VIQDYPKTALAAEAQYRIGYTYETALDDFTTARQEYAKVRDRSVGSAFFTQATDRQQSLDRLERFRSAGADSVDRQVEAGFLLAEQYLFQLDKPERALEAYADITRDHPGTPAAGKALNAQAWVLRRKLDRPAEADSLLWKVVHEYPATEAQLAARDYLEAAGHKVPAELIQVPGGDAEAPPDTTIQLTSPPDSLAPLGTQARSGTQLGPAVGESPVTVPGALRVGPAATAGPDSTLLPPAPAPAAAPSLPDTTARPAVIVTPPVHSDTTATARPPAPPPARPDTTTRVPPKPAPPAHPDTTWAPR
jgi:tetratricopeptide repeat protein